MTLPKHPYYSIKHGAISALMAALIFSFVYVMAKTLSAHYHIIQVVFFRYFLGLISGLVYFHVCEDKNALKLEKRIVFQHAIRGVFGMIAATLLFYAFTMMPLGDAVSLNFSSSLFLCLLSGPLLKEKVDLNRWMAVLFGFVGVVIIANPTGEVFNYGTFLVLGCAMIDAYVLLKGRLFSRTMPIGVVVVYYNCFAALSSLVFLPFVWMPISFYDLMLFIAIGLLGGVGQLALTYAFKSAPVSVIGPIGYTAMIWSIIFGYLIWNDVPSLLMLVGCMIITSAGIYIVRHEKNKNLGDAEFLNKKKQDEEQRKRKKA